MCIIGFWKVTSAYGEFSNWYMKDFVYKGITFNCSEQALMWEKAVLFNDKDIADKILASKDPKQIKALGREVRNFDDSIWSQKRYDIMVDILAEKFKDEKLKHMLLNTADVIIVEASPLDKIWGVGLALENPRIYDEEKWNGTNLLGKALMQVREQIRKEEK